MEDCRVVYSNNIIEKLERIRIDFVNYRHGRNFILISNNEAVYIDYEDYMSCRCKEITQADFLALPEPFKVGDWVRNGGLKRFGISQIFSIQDNKINTVKSDVDDSERFLDIKDCTKLTPEQIKVLGLEE